MFHLTRIQEDCNKKNEKDLFFTARITELNYHLTRLHFLTYDTLDNYIRTNKISSFLSRHSFLLPSMGIRKVYVMCSFLLTTFSLQC